MNDNSEQIKLAQEYFANITRKYQHLDSISSSDDEGKTEVSFSEIYQSYLGEPQKYFLWQTWDFVPTRGGGSDRIPTFL